jgi:hypothetical protein
VILETVDLFFGDHVTLGGYLPFVVIVLTMLAAEAVVRRVSRALA